MVYIVITLPTFIEDEAEIITSMFQSGLEILHLRKPDSEISKYRELISHIPKAYHSNIVIHEHFELLKEFNIRGIHLNRRNPVCPTWWKGKVSTSCHSLEELKKLRKQNYTYLTLSPIYDSVSKEGYKSAYTPEDLLQAKEMGLIDSSVYALGGITVDNLTETEKFGFGGVMILGDAWKRFTKPDKYIPVVLTVAGSDPTSGAGIQQDLKTITNIRCYGATVITSLTAQNTLGVKCVESVSPMMLQNQLDSVMSDLEVNAIKIGMIYNKASAEIIADLLRKELAKRPIPVIYDPVMISTSGKRLMEEDCINFIVNELMPLCSLITPNIPEYEFLKPLINQSNIKTAVLIKGGHSNSSAMIDELRIPKEDHFVEFYKAIKINTTNLHGTGCTMSSAIASYMAKGKSMQTAVKLSKQYITNCIQSAVSLNIGHGNGPLYPFFTP